MKSSKTLRFACSPTAMPTRTAFLPQDRDPHELDLYDANAFGGLPTPKPTPPICEGEACRTATSPIPPEALPTTPLSVQLVSVALGVPLYTLFAAVTAGVTDFGVTVSALVPLDAP